MVPFCPKIGAWTFFFFLFATAVPFRTRVAQNLRWFGPQNGTPSSERVNFMTQKTVLAPVLGHTVLVVRSVPFLPENGRKDRFLRHKIYPFWTCGPTSGTNCR